MGFPSNWETCREAPGPGPPVADTPRPASSAGSHAQAPPPPRAADVSGLLARHSRGQTTRGVAGEAGDKCTEQNCGGGDLALLVLRTERWGRRARSASPTAPARCSPQPGPPRARARTSPSPCSAAGGGARRHHTAPRLRPRGAGRSAGSGTTRVSARPAGPKGPPRGSRGQKQPPPTPAFSNFPDVPRNRVSKRTV